MQMIDILRQVKDPDEFDAAKARILRLAREKLNLLERREFKVEDMAIRVQLTKPLASYVKTTPLCSSAQFRMCLHSDSVGARIDWKMNRRGNGEARFLPISVPANAAHRYCEASGSFGSR